MLSGGDCRELWMWDAADGVAVGSLGLYADRGWAAAGAEHYEVSSPTHEDAVLLRTGEGRLQVVPAATQRQRAKAGLLLAAATAEIVRLLRSGASPTPTSSPPRGPPRHDLLRRHPAQRRPCLPVRQPHQRRPGRDQHLPQDDDLRAAGERFMVMLSAGNLSISQSVREVLQVEKIDNGTEEGLTSGNATSMFDATRVLGAAVRRVYEQDGAALKERRCRLQRQHDLRRPDQGRGDAPLPRLQRRQLHRSHARDLLLPGGRKQVRQAILDRVLTPSTALDEAAKCALVSMDSTLKSNLSVGPAAGPAGLPRRQLQERRDRLPGREQPVLQDDPQHLGPAPARGVREHRRPALDGGDAAHPLMVKSARYEPMRKITKPSERIV